MSALLENARLALKDLSSAEKLLLGFELIDAAHGEEDDSEVAQAWDKEIQRRVEEIRAGKATLTPWEEAIAKTNHRFGWNK